jgi:hypothetical protein
VHIVAQLNHLRLIQRPRAHFSRPFAPVGPLC